MKKVFFRVWLLMALAAVLTGCESSYGKELEELRQFGAGSERTPGEAALEAENEEIVTKADARAQNPASLDGAFLYFKTQGNYLSAYNGTAFAPLYIKGVNLGLGKPGYYPGETAITREEYARWFSEIGEMNANCIRVYTVQSPAFYEALYEYNQSADQPLYLFQGTWYDEDRLSETADAFDSELLQYLYQDMEDLVNLIHGNCTIEEKPGRASGIYEYDISPYVIGWILGIESDAAFVETTDGEHPELTSYEGKYICARDVEPFEVFWAQTGDYVVSYEMEHYGMQRPVSYSNWLTADVLVHPSETMEKEDKVDLTCENLQATSAFPAGLFATYHIYPYYPNFMYTQKEYIEYRDENGGQNPYKAYLEDLLAQHTMPVLVGEFGVPVSRGVTHVNPITQFNQGGHSEQEQGEMLASMMQDIHDTGYAGGLVFTWQDEWFKRTWNTENYSNPQRRAYWYDAMTCEQHFGLLDFVPGEGEETVILDGRKEEWSRGDVLLKTKDTSLSVKYDCAYLYLMIDKKNADYEKETLLIPFDITPHSGSSTYEKTGFERPVDFVLSLKGGEASELFVQSYYDRYLFDCEKYDKTVSRTAEMKAPDNTVFRPIEYLIEVELKLPDRGEVIPIRKYNGGKLSFGTTDYASPQYDSTADFCFEGDIMEIRIPWLLLNFRDPSQKEIEGDFWKQEAFVGQKINSIWLGLCKEGDKEVRLKEYQWEDWEFYPYFERLRKSYDTLQKQFAMLEPQ